MSQMDPSPRTTLVILLGASEWPLSSLQASPAFARSASKVKDYFCNPRLFGLPSENWLDLFNRSQSSPNDVDKAIGDFLDERISMLKQSGTPARDLLFYYIGHGVFALGPDQAYHLAIRSTRDESLRASAIGVAALAETLKEKARHLRRIVILDCCFAWEFFKYMQSAPDQVAIQQTMSVFEEKSKSRGFPEKGTALLCSSGHKEASLILPDESGTMFSEALVRALSRGNERQGAEAYLSLYDLKRLTQEVLEGLAEGGAPRPFLGSPDQSEGDVADVPFFPNPWVEKERQRAEAEAEQVLQAEEEKSRLIKELILHRETEEYVSPPVVPQSQVSVQFPVSTSTVFPSLQHTTPSLSSEPSMLPIEPVGQPSSSFVAEPPVATKEVMTPAPMPEEKHAENAPMAIRSSRAAGAQTTKSPLNAPLDGADVLRSVRSRTLPSTWRVFSSSEAIPIALGAFIIYGIAGMITFFIVLSIADSIPVGHNFLVQMHINNAATNGTGLPDSLQWVPWVAAGIGGILGSVYAWKRQMSFVLVLLPYGFVYGRRGQKQASLVVNFQEVAAMSMLLPKDMIVMILSMGLTRAFIKQFWNRLKIFPRGFLDKALSITLLTSNGETSTIVQEMDIDSDDIPRIIATYEQFKARSSG